MKHIHTINLCLLLCLSAQTLFAQTKYSKETLEQIKAVENGLTGRVKIEGFPDRNILDRMKELNVKGVSIAVIHDYKIVWAKGYGWANEAKKPVTPETLFEPGSISKSLNAIGVLKLVQDKKLDLDVDINTYLTSWKFPYDSVSKGKKITIKELLSHSAGLTVHGFPGYDLDEKMPTVPQVLDGAPPANSPPVRSEFEPGLKYQYSGGGVMITQLIITDITKQPYDAFIYENVLKPIGMIHSFYTQPPAQDKRALCATGYNPDGTSVHNKFHAYPEQAAAGLWMTPGDLCNYIIETQLAYEGKSAKVLSRDMTKLRLTPYNDPSSALGVFIEKHGDALYFQHDAGNEGFCGTYFGSMEGGEGVVIFCNSSNFNIVPEIVYSVASAYHWKDFYTPIYKKKPVQVAESILQMYPGIYLYDDKWASVSKKGKDYYFYSGEVDAKMYFTDDNSFYNLEFQAEKQFTRNDKGQVTGYKRRVGDKEFPAAVKIANPDTIHLDRTVLNDIAWYLLTTKRPAEAMVYLKRGVQLYPTDPFILGNLADSYLLTHKYKQAIEIYKAHLNDKTDNGHTLKDAIKQDFTFFKRKGVAIADIDKAAAELGLGNFGGH